jgi:biopolymer transport protein ExbB/TolQ
VTTSTQQFESEGGNRNVPVPSVSLGLGNDLDPKFGRWIITGGIVGFLIWAVNFPEAMPGHALFHQRGPTQVATLILGGMLGWFLIGKLRILQAAQKAYLAFDLEIPSLVRQGDLDAIKLKSEQSGSLVGKRLLHLLDVWESTGSAFQLERAADGDVDLYELSMSSSFSFPKLLLWAIPLTGFIGTVIGMSQAVGSFDAVLSNADNVDGLKDGLVQVTGGLGTAFDTTFLALVISVFLAFPLTLCEKIEDRLLSQIDGVVRDAVLSLSPLGSGEIASQSGEGSGGGNGSNTTDTLEKPSPKEIFGDDIAGLISDAFEKHLPDPSVLVEPAQAYAETLTEATIEKLTPLTTLVRDSVEGVSEARLSLQEQTDVIRNAMNLLAGELSDLLAENRIGIDQKSQIKSLIELKDSIDQLNQNLTRKSNSFRLEDLFSKIRLR